MNLITLASGSSGNAILLSSDGVYVLVDCGISLRRMAACLDELGLSPDDLAALFITHEHSDHIGGLATILKRCQLPIYASPGTAGELRRRLPFPVGRLRELEPGEPMELGPFTVTSFPTSHDAAQPTGYSFAAGGKRASVVTDLGYVSPAVLEGVLGSQLVVCEANHDVDMLRAGPYPYHLKARILGPTGHLSNEAGAALAAECARAGARTILLAHLSQQNNTPARALAAAEAALREAGIRGVTLAAAPREHPSALYEI